MEAHLNANRWGSKKGETIRGLRCRRAGSAVTITHSPKKTGELRTEKQVDSDTRRSCGLWEGCMFLGPRRRKGWKRGGLASGRRLEVDVGGRCWNDLQIRTGVSSLA